MNDKLLKGIDGDTISFEFVPLIERSLGLEFGESELEHVSTFGKFCEIVQGKLPHAENCDCTPQQAFYRFRGALAKHLPTSLITPTASLEALLPKSRGKREKLIEDLESELGFPLNITGIPDFILMIISGTFFLSIVAFFFHWQTGVVGLFLFFMSWHLTGKYCQRVEVQDIREVIERITRENYRQVRRNPDTINKHEIVPLIKSLFHHELGIEYARMTPDARF